jgi:uncharacterized protein HemX
MPSLYPATRSGPSTSFRLYYKRQTSMNIKETRDSEHSGVVIGRGKGLMAIAVIAAIGLAAALFWGVQPVHSDPASMSEQAARTHVEAARTAEDGGKTHDEVRYFGDQFSKELKNLPPTKKAQAF